MNGPRGVRLDKEGEVDGRETEPSELDLHALPGRRPLVETESGHVVAVAVLVAVAPSVVAVVAVAVVVAATCLAALLRTPLCVCPLAGFLPALLLLLDVLGPEELA